jgi:hypothetical protein
LRLSLSSHKRRLRNALIIESFLFENHGNAKRAAVAARFFFFVNSPAVLGLVEIPHHLGIVQEKEVDDAGQEGDHIRAQD